MKQNLYFKLLSFCATLLFLGIFHIIIDIVSDFMIIPISYILGSSLTL